MKPVRIGVSALGYQCQEHLAEVLQPWFDLRKTGHPKILISAAYGVFPEVHRLNQSNPQPPDGSLQSLRGYLREKQIDALFVARAPKSAVELRTRTLPYLLQRHIDLLWQLDLQDEIYSVDEIRRIVDFIDRHKDMLWFKVNFKNYAFAFDRYVEDFVVGRIWRVKIPASVHHFTFDLDDCITYEDGREQDSLPHGTIPRNLAFPKHLSWVGTPAYLKSKIEYQLLHYGTCAYKWQERSNTLQFNKDYYRKFRKTIPAVRRDPKVAL